MSEIPNIKYIEELAGGSDDFKSKILNIIKKELPEEKEEFETNYQNNNLQKAAENVHKLKNKIGMMGLDKGYQTAIDFEKELRAGKPSLFGEFILTLESIEHFLKKF